MAARKWWSDPDCPQCSGTCGGCECEACHPLFARWTVDDDGWLCENGKGIFRIGTQLAPSSYVLNVLNREPGS